MVRLVLILIFIISFNLYSDDIDIPDELYPIEGNSEILYSYEFDDQPKFITRISTNEFLVMIFDGEDAITYLYNTTDNSMEKKTEFLINDDEWLKEHKVVNNKLILRFANSEGSFFLDWIGSSDGFYWRETIIDLKTFMPESSRIFFTTIFEEDFDLDDYNDDLEYTDKKLDKKLFHKELDEKEIDPEDFRYYAVTYNEIDSNRKNYFHLIIDDNDYTMYGLSSNYYEQGDSPDTKLVVLQDSAEDYEYITFQYSYLDEKSNLYFVMSWVDDDNEKRYLVVNKLTKEGKLTQKSKEVAYEIDDDEYMYKRFEPISITGDKIKLFGISRFGDYDDEDQGLEPISSLSILEFDMNTLDFEFKERHITDDEGEEINKGEDDFKFNIIDKIIETDKGYVLLTENNLQHEIVVQGQYGATTTYLYYFNDINLFALDKDLNVIWNNFTDREINKDGFINGNPTNSYFGTRNPLHINLKPELNNDIISFTYSTEEPEEDIRRVKYNIKTGEKTEEISLFENDDVPSFYPGYQFPLGNNEYVTLINQKELYLVRYKLLK